ncbi:hypothetical protein BRAO375_3660043 [Bradyrhizobium sp. ORS 375]|uniref:hypothetical protein n=1 Tax=Bradyrhizobium sp. (strain ORS 375) TaxID=566679 RepID=UPI000240698B|nr:hypothetical protein [Bradyrhizobium sp. ORS 375]CCD94649.1 hypothetical protein BRAO375_3660043 [Bradyrhizobium sp. ORS 375]
MFRLYASIVFAGVGISTTIDSALFGSAPLAVLFGVLTVSLLFFGWFDLKEKTATKADNDILRSNIDVLIETGARNAQDAVFYRAGLVAVRDAIDAGRFETAREVAHDAVADFLTDTSLAASN